MSDLHFEFMKNPSGFFDQLDLHIKNYDTDVLILAGDICQLSLGFVGLATDLFKTFAKLFPQVVYVTGNHEYFKTTYSAVEFIMDEMEASTHNFHYLTPGVDVTIGKQRFMGGALFYDGKHGSPALEAGMPDFHYIKDIHTGFYYKHNADFVEKVCKNMGVDDIIVSHHLPSPRSIAAPFMGSPLNAFFMSNQSDYIYRNTPKLWVHGHTHVPQDYVIVGGKGTSTRVYCNPLGYKNEGENPKFWERVQLYVP